MWFPDSISGRLRALLGARPRAHDGRASRARRDALEARLLTAHAERFGDRTGTSTGLRMGGLALVGRLALASVALTVAGVAACQIPVEVEVELGRRYRFELAVADGPGQLDALAAALESGAGVEAIEVRIHGDGGETLSGSIDVWGTDLDLDAVAAIVAAHELTPVEVETLEGSVRTTFGDRLGHQLFDLELDLERMDVDEARAAILDQLAAQGFTGEAEVEVEDRDGDRRIEIRLYETDDGHTPAPSP